MKKRMILAAGLMLLLIGSSVAAEKARFLAEDGDRAYHGRHLMLHTGTEDCRICGNYLKVRARPDGNAAVIGHVEQADLVRLQEVSGGWARILVLYSAETSPDSFAGMEGWVDAAYLECGCSERTYYAGGADAAQGGEITAGAVNLRETPSGKSRSLGKLERGERVRVLGQYGKGAKTFYRVVRTSGQGGFVSAEYLEVGGSLPEMAYETEQGRQTAQVSTSGVSAIAAGWNELLDEYYAELRKRETGDFGGLIGTEPELISLQGAGYCFVDVDRDGDAELLILDDDLGVAALYTRKNGKVYHVFDGWARNRYGLCKEGLLYNAGSEGADKSIEALLRLSGTKLVLEEAIYTHPAFSGDPYDVGFYYTVNQQAYDQWFSEEVDPVSLGAEKITEKKFAQLSGNWARLPSGLPSEIRYFRNYR